jgi:hypothetical protein
MWYKLAVSKEDASRIIQEELSVGNYLDEASSDSEFIKRKLIQKYGEDYREVINEEVAKLKSELSASRPWEKGSDETNLHGQASGINAFYIMPDGTLTPNLGSHVSFDKILLHRLGVNPSALNDMQSMDRHVLSDLVGAVRVNVSGSERNATIYYPLTREQESKLEDLNINNFDYRNDLSSDVPTVNNNDDLLDSLENIGKELSSLSSNLEDILRTHINTKVNPNFSAGNYNEPYTINENLKNIDEDLFKKLSSVKDDLTYLDSIVDILKGIRS